jgi:hypothetical protein
MSLPAKLRRVCAWCSKKSGGRFESVIEDGDPGAKVTHGICPFCKAEFDADLVARCMELRPNPTIFKVRMPDPGPIVVKHPVILGGY